jgi:hypothetical protein
MHLVRSTVVRDVSAVQVACCLHGGNAADTSVHDSQDNRLDITQHICMSAEGVQLATTTATTTTTTTAAAAALYSMPAT